MGAPYILGEPAGAEHQPHDKATLNRGVVSTAKTV